MLYYTLKFLTLLTQIFMISLRSALLSILLPISLLLYSASIFADIDLEISNLVVESGKSLTKSEKKLKQKEPLLIDELKSLQQSVTTIKSDIDSCISSNQSSVSKIKEDLELLGEGAEQGNREVSQKHRSLMKQRREHESQLATCRLLTLRSNKIIEATTERQQALIAVQLFARNSSVLDHIQGNLENPMEGIDSLLNFVVSTSGFDIIYEQRYLLAMMVVISIVSIFLLRQLLVRRVRHYHDESNRSFARLLQISLAAGLKHYMVALLLTFVFGAYFVYFSLSIGRFPFIALVSIGLFLYVFLTLILRITLNPIAPAEPLNSLPTPVALNLMRRLLLLAKLLFVGFLIFSASNLYAFSDSVTGLLRNIYIAMVVLNLCWAFWLLGYIKGLANTHLLRSIIILTLLSSMFADWAGYNNLSSFILVGVVGSIAAWFLTQIIVTLWTDFFDSLDDGEFGWQQFIRSKIGVKPGDYVPGSMWFRFTFGIVVWSLFAIVILKIWGLSDQSLFAIQTYVIDGFDAGPIRIIPSKLIIAILVFAVFLSVVGWIKRGLGKRWLNRSRMDRGSKESLITLTGYLGMVIALLVGLSVAGVELANLALIAGALSVGIGFGLQNVVNNFVSGIVLLFERPVKTGDWIVVGGTEGYVKRIKLRSTIIQTFDRADVIVPNAEIIASQVTNLMLSDSIGRVKVPIRAAYGTDPRQVEKILIDIARAHPMVVSRSASIDAPWVLFQEFGESALMFELRAFITDIDNKMIVVSEINFSISDAFHRAGIVIPFPQTDLHIKDLRTKDSSIIDSHAGSDDIAGLNPIG
ncbi:MAG: potassium efflux system protein [Polaribacter sp.]|jgi:potassium efflux system protein